ncbi:MAG: thioredoxin [Microbacter sp.]
MLDTHLHHIETAEQLNQIISTYPNVVTVCGRMGPMCIPVYENAEELQNEYPYVQFYDMDFDNPEAYVIRSLPEVKRFMGIPFTIYYFRGSVVRATTGLQTKEEMIDIIETEFENVKF